MPTFPPPCASATFHEAWASRATLRWPGLRFKSWLERLDCHDPSMTDFAHVTS
jgi:hypothetical protein